MKQTSVIFSLLKGIAIVFGFSNMLGGSTTKYEIKNDAASLASDWKTVESDMKVAYNEFRNKYC
ncbi:hypothetical protein [Gemella massiliensis]|uniref:hypothetical protein n=1 Tax=Gemella massiliensis TaxID=1909670 RepID=UPI000930038B|nr:hypothetical protein [Gemella massiliensis]